MLATHLEATEHSQLEPATILEETAGVPADVEAWYSRETTSAAQVQRVLLFA